MYVLKVGRAVVLPLGGHFKVLRRMEEHQPKAKRGTREDETIELVQKAVFMCSLIAVYYVLSVAFSFSLNQ